MTIMASLLRQIVAGPRSRHPEAGLDLCYVTDNIIATSGPSSTYPQRAYRNPTDDLVKFLDYKHGTDWAIWEFRAEGTGYPDSEVYNRINHYPWPDHHPPPFALIPNIMASMRDWLKGPGSSAERVVVVHCKAGKGRSGTVACSFLISEEAWTVEDALAQFTAKRMRSGFGHGVSIPSQLRWIGYVNWWSRHGKVYVERQIEILEVHVWGLRDGVKAAIEGYVDEGKTIKTFHTFNKHERVVMDTASKNKITVAPSSQPGHEEALPLHESQARAPQTSNDDTEMSSTTEPGTSAVIFRPATRIILPTSDVNIDFERRNKATYGFTMVTSVAHTWFNAFFESHSPSTKSSDSANTFDAPVESKLRESGVFEIAWDAMDGIKGSARKGTRALDRLAVVWRAVSNPQDSLPRLVTEPEMGHPVPEPKPADWTKANQPTNATLGKDLGMRTESPSSANVSKANSMVEMPDPHPKNGDSPRDGGVKSFVPPEEAANSCEYNLQGCVTTRATSFEGNPPGPRNDHVPVDLGMEKVKSPSHIADTAHGGEDH